LRIYGKSDLDVLLLVRQTLQYKLAVELGRIHAWDTSVKEEATTSGNDRYIDAHQLDVLRADLMKTLPVTGKDSGIANCKCSKNDQKENDRKTTPGDHQGLLVSPEARIGRRRQYRDKDEFTTQITDR
jgi:hypothetical protein